MSELIFNATTENVVIIPTNIPTNIPTITPTPSLNYQSEEVCEFYQLWLSSIKTLSPTEYEIVSGYCQTQIDHKKMEVWNHYNPDRPIPKPVYEKVPDPLPTASASAIHTQNQFKQKPGPKGKPKNVELDQARQDWRDAVDARKRALIELDARVREAKLKLLSLDNR